MTTHNSRPTQPPMLKSLTVWRQKRKCTFTCLLTTKWILDMCINYHVLEYEFLWAMCVSDSLSPRWPIYKVLSLMSKYGLNRTWNCYDKLVALCNVLSTDLEDHMLCKVLQYSLAVEACRRVLSYTHNMVPLGSLQKWFKESLLTLDSDIESIKPPSELDINSLNLADVWIEWKKAWELYRISSGLSERTMPYRYM